MTDHKVEATISLVNDEQMRKLQKKYRGKDYLTDVLAFEISEETPEGTYLLGDIVINRDLAERQARKLGHTVEEEMAFLAAHAMLHLLGQHHHHHEE